MESISVDAHSLVCRISGFTCYTSLNNVVLFLQIVSGYRMFTNCRSPTDHSLPGCSAIARFLNNSTNICINTTMTLITLLTWFLLKKMLTLMLSLSSLRKNLKSKEPSHSPQSNSLNDSLIWECGYQKGWQQHQKLAVYTINYFS